MKTITLLGGPWHGRVMNVSESQVIITVPGVPGRYVVSGETAAFVMGGDANEP